MNIFLGILLGAGIGIVFTVLVWAWIWTDGFKEWGP